MMPRQPDDIARDVQHFETHQGKVAPLEWDDLPRWVRIVIMLNLFLVVAAAAAVAGAVALNVFIGTMAAIADPFAGKPW